MAIFRASRLTYLSLVLVLFGCAICAGQPATTPKPGNGTISISLADFDNSTTKGQVFYERVGLKANGESVIEIKDIPVAVSFLIVQMHVHENNVTLSYDMESNYGSSNRSLFGTNLGLEINVKENSSASVYARSNNSETTDALVAIVAYTDKAPTPGGCNLEFDIEISPFQKLIVTESTITLDAQPASAPVINGHAPPCAKHPVKLDAYRMYLPEREFSPETYFDGILKMMTVESIIENGQKVRPAVGASTLRRVFSAYPGTGSVYAIIATYGNYSAAYVPAVTYACSPGEPSSCNDLNTGVAKGICAIVLIIGFIIAFVGHKCLGFEVVFLGAISGGIICYSVLAAIGYFGTTTVFGIVMGVSCLSGISWLMLSLCMGMPCIVTFLASMTLGFFVASTVYFGIADDTPLFESDVNFWLIYVGVTLLVPLVLAVLPFRSNIVCCAILGSYSIILPIDYYAGSNLKYIVINTVRRATVSGFNMAVIQPPYQGTDKCLVAFLIIIALLGIYTQVGRICWCRGGNYMTVRGENVPTISDYRNGRRVMVLGGNDQVESHSCFDVAAVGRICCCERANRTDVYWADRRPIVSEPRNGRRVMVLGQNDRVESHSCFA